MTIPANFDLTIADAQPGYTVTIERATAGAALPAQALPVPLDVALLPRQRRDVAEWIAQARITRLSTQSAELQQVQAFGCTLFEGLFQGEVLSCFRESRRTLPPGERLRVRLRTPPDLAPVPWELLYDPEEGQFVALMPDVVLLRCPPELSAPLDPLRIDGPLQVVVVLASPARYPQINLDRELRWIQEALRGPIERGHVVLEVIRGAGTLDRLRERLRTPLHILHILCHGDIDTARGEGHLVFEDPTGDAEKVSAELLRLQIQKQRGQARLVVLNACLGALPAGNDPFSSVGAALIRGGVPAVIAMQFEIPEESAADLTRVLYAELAAGAPVDLALDEARLTLYGRDTARLDWAVPVLFTRSNDAALFDGIEAVVASDEPTEPAVVAATAPAVAAPAGPAPAPSASVASAPAARQAVPIWAIGAAALVIVVLLFVVGSQLGARKEDVADLPIAATPVAQSEPTATIEALPQVSQVEPTIAQVQKLPAPTIEATALPTLEPALDPGASFADFATIGSPAIIGRRLTIAEWRVYVDRYIFGDLEPSRVVLIGTDNTPELADLAEWRGGQTIRAIQSSLGVFQMQAGSHIIVAPDGIWLFTPMSHGGQHSLSGDGGMNEDGTSWYSIGVEIVGSYDEGRPEGAAWENAKAVMGALSQRLDISPGELITLQRAFFTTKSSPGGAIDRDWVVAEVESWIESNPAP